MHATTVSVFRTFKGATMQGWKILRHSWKQVFDNFAMALRISAVLFLIRVGIGLYLASFVPADFEADNLTNPSFSGPYVIFGIVSGVCGLWIAVAWHRYVLTGEVGAGWIPKIHGGRMWYYFWNSVLIVLILAVPLIISAFLVTSIAVSIQGANPDSVLFFILPAIASLPLIFFFFRLSPLLPAAALGEKLKVTEAWRHTKGSSGTILFYLVFIGLLMALSNLILPSQFGDTTVVSVIYTITVGWVEMMVGISILTTFYGHYVEKRELV